MTEKSGHRKDDNGKVRWSLFPFDALTEILKVLEFGAKKYTDDGWKHVENGATRYFNAAMRHLTAFKEGEIYDPESGLHHLAHAGCSVIFALWHWLKDNGTQNAVALE